MRHARVRVVVGLLAAAAVQHAGAAPISVSSATYGAECGALPGNLTHDAAAQCNDRDSCAYAVHRTAAGTSGTTSTTRAPCRGSFKITWSCGTAQSHAAQLAAEAGESTLVISCLIPAGAGH